MSETDIVMAEKAIKDQNVLFKLLEGISSKKDEIRYSSFKALLIISEEYPEKLYPEWDFFAGLINSDNSYKKLIALRLIANLTKVDTKNKF